MSESFPLAGLLARGGFCSGVSMSAEGMAKSWKHGSAGVPPAIVSQRPQRLILCAYPRISSQRMEVQVPGSAPAHGCCRVRPAPDLK